MKILVTGATGFVAGHLLPRLVADGHEVAALGHDPARIPTLSGLTPVHADLARPLDEKALPPFDAVVQLAQANVPFPEGAHSLFHVNVFGTHQLLEAARKSGASRFVYASSGSVYGLGEGAVREDDERRADDFYAVTKRSGELLVGSYRAYFATTILRFFTPYGPGQRGRLIPGLVDRVRRGEAITLRSGGRPCTTPIFVGDAIEVVARALDSDGHHLLNVAGDEVASIRDLGQLIGDAVGRAPLFEEATGDSTGDLIGSNDRMHELLGSHSLVPLPEGLRRTVAAG